MPARGRIASTSPPAGGRAASARPRRIDRATARAIERALECISPDAVARYCRSLGVASVADIAAARAGEAHETLLRLEDELAPTLRSPTFPPSQTVRR